MPHNIKQIVLWQKHLSENQILDVHYSSFLSLTLPISKEFVCPPIKGTLTKEHQVSYNVVLLLIFFDSEFLKWMEVFALE